MPSHGPNGPETGILPFPNLTLLQTYADDIRRSIQNPSLQSAQIDFMLMNSTAILDALKDSDKDNATLVNELDSLKIAHARLEVVCSQTHANNGWLSERHTEAHKANTELIAANQELESKLSCASTRERKLMKRVAEMERAVRKLSVMIIKKHVGPYKEIEAWVKRSLPALPDQITEGHQTNGCIKSSLQGQNAVGIMRELKKRCNTAAIDSSSHGLTSLEDELWDDTHTSTPESGCNSAVAKQNSSSVSEVASEASMRTDVIYSLVQKRLLCEKARATRRSVIATSENVASKSAEFQPKTPVNNITTSTIKNNTHNKAVVANTTTRNMKPEVQSVKPANGTNTTARVMSGVLKEPILRTHQVNSPPKGRPFTNHSGPRSPPKVTQGVHKQQQSTNTCQDMTRYADITRDFGKGDSNSADSINPQVVVADPNEVAGDWNDVPVPIELRRIKAPEKAPPIQLTCERNVFMVGLPPTITVAMLAAFVRGGKVERIIIIDEGKRVGVQCAIISFFSRRAARKLVQWMLETPRLVIDRHIARPSLSKTVPPPIVPSGGGSRVIIIKPIPIDIEEDEEFWNYIHRVAERYSCKIGVQETRIWPIEGADGEEGKGFAGVVVFDTYHMGLEMSKILRHKLKLEVKWGHDRCEDDFVTQKIFEFVEYKKKKQYDDESD